MLLQLPTIFIILISLNPMIMKKTLKRTTLPLLILIFGMFFTSCNKDYAVSFDTKLDFDWGVIPDGENFDIEILVDDDAGHRVASFSHNITVNGMYSWDNHFYDHSILEKGHYKLKVRVYGTVNWPNGTSTFVDKSGSYDSYFTINNDNAATTKTNSFYLDLSDYDMPSGGGGGGGGGSSTVTDHLGHDISDWEVTSNGNYRKQFVANYVVMGNYQAYPSNTNWTYTVNVEYRPSSKQYWLFEPYFYPNSNGGLGLGYPGNEYDISWGYNSVRVHTYTHYDSYDHIMYEADCYCRFTIS